MSFILQMVTFLFPAFQPYGNRINEKVNEKQYNEKQKKMLPQSISLVHIVHCFSSQQNLKIFNVKRKEHI